MAPYKISGTTDAARIIIIKESDWSIESNTNESSGSYGVDGLESGKKLVLARKSDGEALAFGNVDGVYYVPAVNGVWAGGNTGGYTNVMDYVVISTTGDATDFGDMTTNRDRLPGCSNGTNNRGLFWGGYASAGGNRTSIDYIDISTPGNAADFGDMTEGKRDISACSNGTNNRGLCAGGYTASSSPDNQIEYINISSLGNSAHFGSLTDTRYDDVGTDNGTNNRGIFAGGYNWNGTRMNWIEYVTITSLGNSTDFGDLTRDAAERPGAASNRSNNRGVFAGGHDEIGVGSTNIVDYITITSTGNATDFGDLTNKRSQLAGCSSGTQERAVFGGGAFGGSGYYTTMDYITINSTGNATSFGSLSVGRRDLGACSNA